MIKIEDNYQKTEIEEKRFYMPCKVIVTCPKCNYEYEDDNYLSYPIANKDIDYDCYCGQCDHEWSEKVKIVLGIEVVGD